MSTAPDAYAARLDIDYPDRLDRLTTFFRLIWAIPILIILGLLTATGNETVITETGEQVTTSGGGIAAGLFAATLLMILFRQRYPRWWFDFARELTRFQARIGAYLALLTDRYPSTVDEQAVHLEIDYPDAERDLNRWLPLVKWLLAIPHYIVLFFLALGALVAVIIAWFAILFTGRYPRALFDYVVGVGRWSLRVQAYAFLLVTGYTDVMTVMATTVRPTQAPQQHSPGASAAADTPSQPRPDIGDDRSRPALPTVSSSTASRLPADRGAARRAALGGGG